MATPTEFATTVDRFLLNEGKLNSFINGAADDPDIVTDSGTIPTLAKLVENLAFPSFASLALANATIAAIGKVFYNTTTEFYEVTTDIS